MGAAALLVASGLPAGPLAEPRRPRPGVGAAPQEAGIPVVFHVGGTGDLIDPAYFRNGLPIPPDFHGGEENFRSVDYMGIPGPPAQTLATMIFDGVLERFPDLRIGVIEQGAIWVPSWMRQMESAFEAFARHEERLQALSLRPERVRAPPDPVHAVPDRGRRLDHRAGRARGRACSRPTTRTSRAAGARSSGSRRRSATRRDDVRQRVLPRQLPRPHGHRRLLSACRVGLRSMHRCKPHSRPGAQWGCFRTISCLGPRQARRGGGQAVRTRTRRTSGIRRVVRV